MVSITPSPGPYTGAHGQGAQGRPGGEHRAEPGHPTGPTPPMSSRTSEWGSRHTLMTPGMGTKAKTPWVALCPRPWGALPCGHQRRPLPNTPAARPPLGWVTCFSWACPLSPPGKGDRLGAPSDASLGGTCRHLSATRQGSQPTTRPDAPRSPAQVPAGVGAALHDSSSLVTGLPLKSQDRDLARHAPAAQSATKQGPPRCKCGGRGQRIWKLAGLSPPPGPALAADGECMVQTRLGGTEAYRIHP